MANKSNFSNEEVAALGKVALKFLQLLNPELLLKNSEVEQ